jgi:hypothetical protein
LSLRFIEESALSRVDRDGGGGTGGLAANGGGGEFTTENLLSVSNFATKPSRSVLRSEINERTFGRSLVVSSVSSV